MKKEVKEPNVYFFVGLLIFMVSVFSLPFIYILTKSYLYSGFISISLCIIGFVIMLIANYINYNGKGRGK